MVEQSRFKGWYIEPNVLKTIDLLRARDLVVECFFQAQRETQARSRKGASSRRRGAGLYRTVEQIVRLAFHEAGYDFEQPTAAALMEVAEVLTRKAQAWGTPEDIIKHHRSELNRLFVALQV